jgi:hypothetical protein
MTFEYTLYPSSTSTPLVLTVEARSEDEAQLILSDRLLAIGIGPEEAGDWKVAVVVQRKGRA